MNGHHRVILHEKLHRNQPGKLKNKGTLFEKKAPKEGAVRGSKNENVRYLFQIVYQTIELIKLSNFCEDTSWLSIMVWEWYPKNQNLISIFKKMIREYFHRQSTKIWAQIEARDIYYLIPFNLESNDTKHDMVPNGSDPYGQVTIW